MSYIILTPVIARNVSFGTGKNKEFLRELRQLATSPEAKKWVTSNLTTWIINDFRAKPVNEVQEDSEDWVEKALSKGDKVYRVDFNSQDKKKLKDIVKFASSSYKANKLQNVSVPQLIEAMKKENEKNSKQKQLNESEEAGTKVIHIYPNGYHWVENFGKESINREGKLMQNCLKTNDYGNWFERVKNGSCQIYSLRDDKNKPHISIQFDPKDRTIVQIKGRQNKPVIEKYRDYLFDFIRHDYIGFTSVYDTDAISNGFVYRDKKMYDINNLPPSFVLRGDLRLDGFPETVTLPNNLVVNGIVSFENSQVKKVPSGLKCESLILVDSEITEIPSGITCDYLDASGSKVEKVSEDITVNGTLNLAYSKIKEIPAFQNVESLDISHTEVTSIPKTIKIKEKLNADRTKIRELYRFDEAPKILKLIETGLESIEDGFIGINLNISRNPIKELPEDLIIKSTLDITDTSITKIPESAKIYKIRGVKGNDENH